MHWEQKREVIKMEADKEMLNRLLNEIQELIKENENEDGTYRFDLLKAVIALDFAKTEIEKAKMCIRDSPNCAN